MNKYFALIALLFSTTNQAAVYINEEKTGEAVLLPFYTVANGLNTYINISNDTTDTKIIRVVLREGIDSKRVMSLNVFLSAYDSWTAALGVSENKAVFTSADDSCTNLIDNNSLYDLWTHEVDTDPQAPMTDEALLARIGAGWVEIFELATVADGQAALSAAIQNRDCVFLNQQYEAGGIWQDDLNAQLAPTSGGLHASATIIDVQNGFMTATPATHFAHFYPADTIAHTANTDELPNLSSADTTSLLIHDGEAISTPWPTGYQAITALLMKEEISSEYNVNPAIGGWTEWVMTIPTLRFYQSSDVTGPFRFIDDGQFAGYYEFIEPLCRFGIDLFGRSGEQYSDKACIDISPAPPLINNFPQNVWRLNMNSEAGTEFQLVQTEAQNTAIITYDYDTTQLHEGVAIFDFNGLSQPISSDIGPNDSERRQHSGLPVVGFAFTRFINANAQPGLLANYGTAQPYRSKRLIVTE